MAPQTDELRLWHSYRSAIRAMEDELRQLEDKRKQTELTLTVLRERLKEHEQRFGPFGLGSAEHG